MSIKLIPLGLVRKRDGFNVRKRKRDISWLIASIREHGQVDPVMLLRGRDEHHARIYYLIQGEGRLDALTYLAVPKVRAIVLPSSTPIERQLVLNMVENKHDEVHFIDTARRIHELHNTYGRPFASVADQTGYSYEHVTNACRVIEKVTPPILEAAYTLDHCPVAFLIKLAALDHPKQLVEWDKRFGVAGLDKRPRIRVSMAGIKRLLKDAPPDCRPGVEYVLRTLGAAQ